jgi:predicted transcriptional regulator
MGKPKRAAKIRISVGLDAEAHKAVARRAEKAKLSKASIIRTAVLEYIVRQSQFEAFFNERP